VLVCINCVRPVVFGDRGWEHRDGTSTCPRAAVAWPPAVDDEDDADDGAETAA
jgi:hypothetical protein